MLIKNATKAKIKADKTAIGVRTDFTSPFIVDNLAGLGFDFIYFDLWHHWGRTTKFGAWMQGPDYTQWHGAYEVLRELAELQKLAEEKMAESSK